MAESKGSMVLPGPNNNNKQLTRNDEKVYFSLRISPRLCSELSYLCVKLYVQKQICVNIRQYEKHTQ